MTVDNDLLERCRDELGREIAPEQSELLEELLRHIVGLTASLSLEKVLDSLIQSHHSLSHLMAALLRCELYHLETLLPGVVQRPATEQAVALKQFFERYAQIKDQCITVAERTYQNRIQELHREVELGKDQLLEERAKNDWLRSGQIKLFNYFCELMVLGLARVEQVEAREITVWMTPKLERVFAAGERMRYVYTTTEDPGRTLLLELLGMEDDLLTLRIRGAAPHPQGRRRHMRVSVNDETPMNLALNGQRARAWVLDFSETGLGLMLDTPVPLAVGDKLTCTGTLQAHGERAALKEAPGVVRWLLNTGEQTRFGVQLELEERERQALHAVLLGYEQAIIQQLRKLGTPEALL